MSRRPALRATLFLLLSSIAFGQVLSFPGSNPGAITTSAPLNLVQATAMDSNLWLINTANHSPLESLSGSISRLDLKAPGKAQHEFEKGYQLLMKKDFPGATEHLNHAISIYPKFVAAHNALGNAYLGLTEKEKARDEFAAAVALDDHLPTSYMNLGCAELGLEHYAAAEQAIQKAADIAPLDLQLLTALAYGQFVNHHYSATVDTARKVHERKHNGAAMVHFYAAAAWEAQGDYKQAGNEIGLLLREDPKSPAAEQARRMLENLRAEATRPALVQVAEIKPTYSFETSHDVTADPSQIPANIRKKMQEAKEMQQLAEAASIGECDSCEASAETLPMIDGASADVPAPPGARPLSAGLTFHASTNEVAVFFSATDHGVSVTNLTRENIAIRDDGKAPAAFTGFHNEADLPLRLGLVIDTSDSVAKRLKFEEAAAADFMRKVMTRPEDLAFVVGFANSVLMVQDLTADPESISHSVEQLAPAGGTALWDAVRFAADKLGSHAEDRPVAKVMVVISDGEDNSSSTTAKEAIAQAQRGGVTIFTISTHEITDSGENSEVGTRALKTLTELTGGAAFAPGSVRGLNGSLNDLQQVIRGRYLVTYKPAAFQRDGKYHAIAIEAVKGGRKLHVSSRKGYYASAAPTTADH